TKEIDVQIAQLQAQVKALQAKLAQSRKYSTSRCRIPCGRKALWGGHLDRHRGDCHPRGALRCARRPISLFARPREGRGTGIEEHVTRGTQAWTRGTWCSSPSSSPSGGQASSAPRRSRRRGVK